MATSSLTIKEYILWYLNKYGESCVHDMYAAYTKQSTRQMRYTSFRTEVAWLSNKKHKYIQHTSTDPDGIDPEDGRWKFGKSYYIAIKSLGDYQTAELHPGRPKND